MLSRQIKPSLARRSISITSAYSASRFDLDRLRGIDDPIQYFDQLLSVKRAEWADFRRHVSPWEHARYGDL